MDERVISFGSILKGRDRKIWNGIERKIADEDPNYFFGFNLQSLTKGTDKEFFVLHINGEYVGRGVAVLDKSWGKDKKSVGFIDDFMVAREYRDDVDILIQELVSFLKNKGAEEIIVRGGLFPAIETAGYEELPSFGCPHNPSWYVEIFERNGFKVVRRFVNYRIKLPELLIEGKSGKEITDDDGRVIRELNRKNIDEVKKYVDIMKNASFAHFFGWDTSGIEEGFTPSRVKMYLNNFFVRMIQYKTFCTFENGEMVSCTTIHPDYNAVLNDLTKGKRGFIPGIKLLGFPFAVRKTRRYVFGGTAQVKDKRGKGYGTAKMVWGVYNVLPLLGKVEEFDTGPIVSENLPPIKMVSSFVGEDGVKEMDYAMMSYKE